MTGPAVTPVASDSNLPAHVDVVVIGGGIIGASTALELAERGVSVLLCEKGQIGAEQSSRNWGWVRIAMRDPREIPLMAEANRIWQGLDARTGRKTGYIKAGIFYPAATDKIRDNFQTWAKHLQPHQIEGRIVTGAEMDALMPGHQMGHQTGFAAGLYTPGDGRAEPQLVTPAIAEAARDAGAHLMTRCAVRSLDITAGRITGVITERGKVACEQVVMAGGAWSRLFSGNAGIELPQLKVQGSVIRTTPVTGGPEVAVGTKGFAIRKRADGGYTVATANSNAVDLVPDSFRLARTFLPALMSDWRSLHFRMSGRWFEEARQKRRWSPDEETPFERCRILDPDPSGRVLRSSWANARRAFPLLEKADIAQSWAGLIDVTPDAIPVISPVDDQPGLFIATGFSGHGFGIGPGAGRLMADLVTGTTPVVDPHDFRLSRFSDGSRIRPNKGY